MEEENERIFSASRDIIGRLHELADFFEDDTVFRIFLRSQLIHKLFEDTPALDSSRLDLYHIQFTESIVDLLLKVRETNEKAVSLLRDEVHFNEQLLARFIKERTKEEGYEAAQHRQAAFVGTAMKGLYENLSGRLRTNPFPQGIDAFGQQYRDSHFYPISGEQLDEWTTFSAERAYRNGYGAIDKKLLGVQCATAFANEFVCGLNAAGDTLEVYRNSTDGCCFVFFPRKRFFNGFDEAHLATLGIEVQQSSKARLIRELSDKNLKLRASEHSLRVTIPEPVRDLLKEYLARVSAMNFLDLRDYEVQANILRTMLNTDEL